MAEREVREVATLEASWSAPPSPLSTSDSLTPDEARTVARALHDAALYYEDAASLAESFEARLRSAGLPHTYSRIVRNTKEPWRSVSIRASGRNDG